MAEAPVPTVIADELHIVYRVNGARTGKGSATAALSRILKRGSDDAARGVRKVHAVRGVSFVAYRGEAEALRALDAGPAPGPAPQDAP